jgi:hypothetical protein
LDVIPAKLWIKSDSANYKDYNTLGGSLKKLQQRGDAADLSFTPKVHSLLTCAPKQMGMFKGIGGNFESRASRLKSANNRAIAQAKMEAISCNNAVR